MTSAIRYFSPINSLPKELSRRKALHGHGIRRSPPGHHTKLRKWGQIPCLRAARYVRAQRVIRSDHNCACILFKSLYSQNSSSKNPYSTKNSSSYCFEPRIFTQCYRDPSNTWQIPPYQSNNFLPSHVFLSSWVQGDIMSEIVVSFRKNVLSFLVSTLIIVWIESYPPDSRTIYLLFSTITSTARCTIGNGLPGNQTTGMSPIEIFFGQFERNRRSPR